MKRFKQLNPFEDELDIKLSGWTGCTAPRVNFHTLAGLKIRVNPSLDVGTNQTGHFKICLMSKSNQSTLLMYKKDIISSALATC